MTIDGMSPQLPTLSLRAQTAMCEIVALLYQHGGVDNKVPQLHATLTEPLD